MLKQAYRKTSRALKYFLFLLLSGTIATVALICFSSGGYFSPHTVTYDKYNFPFIDAELQDNNYSLVFDLGFRFPLFLCRSTLDGIDKQPHGIGQWHTLDGQTCEAPSYLIPEIKIGNLTLKNIIANQTIEEERHGHLGKFLGEEFNLCLDFPNDRIVACDTFSKLQKKNLASEDWISFPFEIHRGGVVFSVDTDFGSLKLALKTACTCNHLRSSFFPVDARFSFVSSSFSIKGDHFGHVTFHPIDLPEGLNGIDGFIGMDFLKDHSLYLDYTHKIAYLAPPKEYFERIPVTFNGHKDALVNVSLEGQVHTFKLDTGSFFSFSLSEEILQEIHKAKYGTYKWFDFRGQQYESPTYFIPEIKIGNLVFPRVHVNQDREDFHTNVTLEGKPLPLSGIIGRTILERYNLFLDFPHGAVYASKDPSLLQKAGLLSQNLLHVPFSLHPDGIFLTVETDEGTYRLILDTGSTRTVIRTPHPALTTKFQIMGHDFGEHSIQALDMTSKFDFDGVLGMDFLLKHPLFIDYTNRQILLDLQTETHL